jgi:hypothetical protein
MPKAGSFLPGPGEEASFVVVSVSEQEIVLGPLKAGEFTLQNICREGDSMSFRIEAPDPQQVKKEVAPLAPTALPYPTWLWFIPILILALLGFLIYLLKKYSDLRRSKMPLRRTLRRRTATEKMEDFLARVEREKILEKDDIQSSQFLYSEGVLRMRAVLQKGLDFKNPGATTSEFIGEFKAQLLKKPGTLNQAQVAKLESIFMQSKQVTYARENPDILTKKAYFKLLNEAYQELKVKLSNLNENPEDPKKKRLTLPKRSPKK